MKKMVMIGIAVFLLTGCSASTPRTPGEFDAFSQCLTENGAVMYGADTCPHCQEQKRKFKGSFDLIKYIECPKEPELCNKAGITGYPTWDINGKRLLGAQSLSQLAEISGCAL